MKETGFTLIDHALTPYSELKDVEDWLFRVETMLRDRPNDQGLIIAWHELLRLKKSVVKASEKRDEDRHQ